MTITDEEIRKDFSRFLRHEAMRANCSQEQIMTICNIPIEMQMEK